MPMLIVISLAAFISSKVKAELTDWSVGFQNNLAGYKDTFTPGVAPDALDGYEFTYDLLQPPGFPSGPYIQMFTVVDNYALTKDIRSPIPLYNTKTWEIKLVAMDSNYVGLTGTNSITWILSESLNELGNEILYLIDYGTDSSRTGAVATIDMRTQDNYSFDVTNVLGPYRYIDFEVQNVPEPATILLLTFGGLALRLRSGQALRKYHR
jgi:hypothetical protein